MVNNWKIEKELVDREQVFREMIDMNIVADPNFVKRLSIKDSLFSFFQL